VQWHNRQLAAAWRSWKRHMFGLRVVERLSSREGDAKRIAWRTWAANASAQRQVRARTQAALAHWVRGTVRARFWQWKQQVEDRKREEHLAIAGRAHVLRGQAWRAFQAWHALTAAMQQRRLARAREQDVKLRTMRRFTKLRMLLLRGGFRSWKRSTRVLAAMDCMVSRRSTNSVKAALASWRQAVCRIRALKLLGVAVTAQHRSVLQRRALLRWQEAARYTTKVQQADTFARRSRLALALSTWRMARRATLANALQVLSRQRTSQRVVRAWRACVVQRRALKLVGAIVAGRRARLTLASALRGWLSVQKAVAFRHNWLLSSAWRLWLQRTQRNKRLRSVLTSKLGGCSRQWRLRAAFDTIRRACGQQKSCRLQQQALSSVLRNWQVSGQLRPAWRSWVQNTRLQRATEEAKELLGQRAARSKIARWAEVSRTKAVFRFQVQRADKWRAFLVKRQVWATWLGGEWRRSHLAATSRLSEAESPHTAVASGDSYFQAKASQASRLSTEHASWGAGAHSAMRPMHTPSRVEQSPHAPFNLASAVSRSEAGGSYLGLRAFSPTGATPVPRVSIAASASQQMLYTLVSDGKGDMRLVPVQRAEPDMQEAVAHSMPLKGQGGTNTWLFK
jgi:hypothetical protein